MRVKVSGSLCDRRAALTMELLERLLETKGFESLKYFDQILSCPANHWNTLLSSQSYEIFWSTNLLSSQSCKLLLALLPPPPLEQGHGVEGAVDRKKEISDKNETSCWSHYQRCGRNRRCSSLWNATLPKSWLCNRFSALDCSKSGYSSVHHPDIKYNSFAEHCFQFDLLTSGIHEGSGKKAGDIFEKFWVCISVKIKLAILWPILHSEHWEWSWNGLMRQSFSQRRSKASQSSVWPVLWSGFLSLLVTFDCKLLPHGWIRN